MPEVATILLVDPDASITQQIESQFGAHKYAVSSACSAFEAFSFLRTRPVHLLLLELDLPDSEGLCLLSMVRRLRPALPVVVFSWDHSIESMLKAMRLGARGYLFKPLPPERVLECVQAILLEARLRPRRRGISRGASHLLKEFTP